MNKINQRIEQGQKQKYMLSMGMKQSFDVLQMSVFDLQSFLEKELEENYLGELVYYHNEKMEFDIADNRDSLESSFLRQLQLNSEINQATAQLILANCDASGYLRCSEKKLVQVSFSSLEEIQKTRNKILNSEPYGISALNVKECLLVQAHYKNNSQLKKLIKNHLDDLSKYNYQKIKKEMKINDEVLKELIEQLHQLNPRPGLQFHLEQAILVKPDVHLEWDNGEILLSPIRYFGIERIQINTENYNTEAMKYYHQKDRRISFLTDCLMYRENTLLKICRILAETQHEYLRYNASKEVLRLKDISEKAGLSIATISRTLKDKYLEVDGRVIALKELLSKEINEFSVDFIKHNMKEIIDDEGVISDSAVSKALLQRGIICSRRTVNKYRMQLNLPSSVKKRRMIKDESEF